MLINNVSKWPPMNVIMMFYTYDDIKIIEEKCIAKKYSTNKAPNLMLS